jgi:hypothetical protein
MTEERLVLAELLEMAGEGDFLRAMVGRYACVQVGESVGEPAPAVHVVMRAFGTMA